MLRACTVVPLACRLAERMTHSGRAWPDVDPGSRKEWMKLAEEAEKKDAG
jgi:hypothetical protein